MNRRGFVAALGLSPLFARLGMAQPKIAAAAPATPVNVTPPFASEYAPDERRSPFLYMLMYRRKVRSVVHYKYEHYDDYNYCEIMRHPFVGNPTWHAGEHGIEIEQALFLGARHERFGSNGRLQTFTGGVAWHVPRIRRRVTPDTILATVAASEAWDFGACGAGGTAKKYLFVPRRLKIEPAAAEHWHPNGRTVIVPTDSLISDAVLVDMGEVRLAVFSGTVFKLLRGNEERASEFLSDVGLELTCPAAHDAFQIQGV